MARWADPAPAEHPDLPEWFGRCWVEDWLTPQEMRDYPGSGDDVTFTFGLAAWRRWKVARGEWMSQQGIPAGRERNAFLASLGLTSAMSQPRWRGKGGQAA